MEGQGKQNNQKLKPYLVYKYLMENSDENHCVSVEAIVAYLIEIMGIMAERRSIYRDIDQINKVLYALRHGLAIDEVEQDIEENEDEDWRAIVYDGIKKGYYMKYRFYDIEEEYDLNDIRTIAACLYSAKFITETKAKEYVNIITKTLVSAEQAKEIKHEALLVDRGKTTNRKVFENVQTIYAAMRTTTGKEKHTPKKIIFKYVSATLKGDTIERRHGERYVVSPFKLIINDGNYYLLGVEDKKTKAAARTFRVDRMKEIKLTGIPREHEEAFRTTDWKAYAIQNFGMYSGKKERVTLQFINILLDTVIDKFGRENLYYQKVDDNHFSVQVEVAVTDQFFGWLCGFGKRVKILAPPPIQEKFIKFLDNIKSKY